MTSDDVCETEFSWAQLCADTLASVKSVDLPKDMQIPTLPTALNEFLKAAEDPDVEFRTLGAIIEHDPGLTIDLLKCVNVSTYASRAPVRSPTEALTRMGVKQAKMYLLSAGMKSTTLSFQSRLMNHRNFWNESLQRALFAQQLAERLKIDRDFAFIGGLLQDYILPILTNQFDSDYIDYLKGSGADGMALHEWEQQTFGWDHAQVGAYVASSWNLPDDLLCAISLHHQMDLSLKSKEAEMFTLFPITLAALLPDQMRQVPNGMKRLVTADAQSRLFDLDALCTSVDAELEKICAGGEKPKCLRPSVDTARASMPAENHAESTG